MKIFSNWHKNRPTKIEPIDENLAFAIDSEEKAAIASRNQMESGISTKGEEFKKGFSGKKISHAVPVSIVGAVNMVDGKLYRDKNTNNYANFNYMLNMYSKSTVVNAIINLRSNQVAGYGIPARYADDGIGYEILLKDSSKTPTKAEIEEIKNIEEFLHYTSRDKSTGINFRTWLKQTVRDILIYDQANTELVYERNSRTTLNSFYAVDAGTIYYITEEDGSMPRGKSSYKYLQKIGDNRAVYFKEGELTFDVMNPRTDIYSFKYGLSPLEVVMNQVSYLALTDEFNNKYFTQGGTTKGLLLIDPGDDSQMSQQAMDDFRRDWQQFQGTNGAHKTPVITGKEAKFVNMNASSKDMEFEKWTSYLINIIASNYGVDPAEIGFPNKGGAAGNKANSLQEASKAETSQLSKDKGLSPLLDFIEDIINDNIVNRFGDGKYIFRFKGSEVAKEIQLLDKVIKEVSNTHLLNEGRKELGMGPVKAGDAVLNQFYINRLGQIENPGGVNKNANGESTNNNSNGKTDDNIMKDGSLRANQSEKQKNK